MRALHSSGQIDRLSADEGATLEAIRSGNIEVRYRSRHTCREALPHWSDGDVTGFDRGLDGALAEFVLNRACRDALRWPGAEDGSPGAVQVAIGSETFGRRSFVTLVRQILLESGLPPTRLQLALDDRADLVPQDARVTDELRAIGIEIVVQHEMSKTSQN